MDQDFLHLIFLWVWEQGWKQTTDWRPWGGRSRNSAALATTILSWNCFCLFVQSLSWSLIRNDFFALALVVCVESGLEVDHWLEALRGRSGNSAAQATTIFNCIFFFAFLFQKGFGHWSHQNFWHWRWQGMWEKLRERSSVGQTKCWPKEKQDWACLNKFRVQIFVWFSEDWHWTSHLSWLFALEVTMGSLHNLQLEQWAVPWIESWAVARECAMRNAMRIKQLPKNSAW